MRKLLRKIFNKKDTLSAFPTALIGSNLSIASLLFKALTSITHFRTCPPPENKMLMARLPCSQSIDPLLKFFGSRRLVCSLRQLPSAISPSCLFPCWLATPLLRLNIPLAFQLSALFRAGSPALSYSPGIPPTFLLSAPFCQGSPALSCSPCTPPPFLLAAPFRRARPLSSAFRATPLPDLLSVLAGRPLAQSGHHFLQLLFQLSAPQVFGCDVTLG